MPLLRLLIGQDQQSLIRRAFAWCSRETKAKACDMKVLFSLCALAFVATVCVVFSSASQLLVDEDGNQRILEWKDDDSCMPQRFEIEGIETSPSVSFIDHFKWTFDGKNQKQFISVELIFPEKTKFNLLYRFDQPGHNLYIFPANQQWCRVMPLPMIKKLETPCFAKGSSKSGHVTIGSDLKCNVWRKTVTEYGFEMRLRLVEEGNVPIYIHSRTSPLGVFHSFVNFFNFQKDTTPRPSKFDIPSVCEKRGVSISRDMGLQMMPGLDVLHIAKVIGSLTGFHE